MLRVPPRPRLSPAHRPHRFLGPVDRHPDDRYQERLCAAVTILCSITGVPRTTAEVMIAEMGTDMTRFPTAGHSAPGPVLPRAATSRPASGVPRAW